MLDAIKQLIESNVITEDTSIAIQEAWDTQLNEAKEVIRSELREEFAQRYNHDKSVMVKALDKMVSESLQKEIEEFAEEKAQMAKDRVKFQKKMSENAAKFNNFLVAKLSEELTELRNDRKAQKEGLEVLESFVAKKLAKEINEFAEDKRDLVETKVKLVAEAKEKLENLRAKFIAESSKKVQDHIKTKLSSELTALKEDINAARENSFGRRIFEAFVNEFMTTHLNENAEVRKLQKLIQDKEKQLQEAAEQQRKLKVLAESKEKKLRMIVENNKRKEKLNELLAPLSKDKREVMSNLLESVQTDRLDSTFEKYLPAVLSNSTKVPSAKKRMVTESVKEVTGNKPAKKVESDNSDATIIDIKKLAGL